MRSLQFFPLIKTEDGVAYIRPIFTQVANHLRAGRLFAFSIELTDKKEPFLGLHSHYLYPQNYLLTEIQNAGLMPLEQKEISLRREGKSFPPSLITLAQK